MIVEFFGAPGAGKSTLLKNLVASVPHTREIKPKTRGEVLWGSLRFLLRHPVSFFVWMWTLLLSANGLFRYKLGLLLRSMAARAYAEAASRETTVCIDEGLTQRILTLCDAPLTQKHAAFLLKMSPRPDLVVALKGGDFGRFTTAEDRMGSPRAHHKLTVEEWMRVVTTNTEVVRQVLPRYTRVVECEQGTPVVGLQREIELARTRVL